MPELLNERSGLAPHPIIMLKDGTVVPAVDEQTTRPAAQANSLSDWTDASIDIVSISIGRQWVWDDWCTWLLNADVPDRASLFLMDNSRADDLASSARMNEFARSCLISGRFRTVSVTRGPGPEGERGSHERLQSNAHALNRLLSMTMGEFVFLLDDDVVPPRDALPRLHAGWLSRASNGERPGLLSGAYPSATNPGCLVAGVGQERWERSLREQPGSNEIVQLDFVGSGCVLADGAVIRAHLPIEAGHGEGWLMGPDAWLSRQLRRSGYTVWLDCGVACEHRFRADF
jgi:hypothetical protein